MMTSTVEVITERGVASGPMAICGRTLSNDGGHDVIGDGRTQVLTIAEVAVQDGAADTGGVGDLLGTGVRTVLVDGRDPGRDEGGAALVAVLGPSQPATVRHAIGSSYGLTHGPPPRGVEMPVTAVTIPPRRVVCDTVSRHRIEVPGCDEPGARAPAGTRRGPDRMSGRDLVVRGTR